MEIVKRVDGRSNPEESLEDCQEVRMEEEEDLNNTLNRMSLSKEERMDTEEEKQKEGVVFGLQNMMMFQPTDSIKLVIEKILASAGKRVIHISQKRASEIISFSDILQFIVDSSKSYS